MKKLISNYAAISENASASLALLFLRLLMGVAFVLHGLPKIESPFSWMGPEAPVPGIFQALAALAEFGGGLPFVSKGTPSYELALVYFVLSFLFLVCGSGRYSLDNKTWAKVIKL